MARIPAATTGMREVELRTGTRITGTRITVRGTAVAAGSKAYIGDGVITSPAPELPQYDVEV